MSSGVSSFLVPIYSTFHPVKELTASAPFGSLGSLHQIMITVGILCSYFLGLLCYYPTTVYYSWTIVLIPCLVSAVEGGFFWMVATYESPVFLWMKGKRREVGGS